MTLKVGDVLRRVTDHKTTITILDLETRDHGPLVQWAGKHNCRTRFVKNWSRSSFELIPSTPTTFEVGKWYTHTSFALPPFEVIFIGKYKVLARRGDDEWVVSLKNFSKHKEYIPPPPEEWRALYWRLHDKPEISAHTWASKEAVERDEKSHTHFMYAIRTDINAKKEN